MGIEIERKFLVVNDSWRSCVSDNVEMRQGYFTSDKMIQDTGQKASMRIRIEGDKAVLNIKSCQTGMVRQEFECPIDYNDGLQLLNLCVGSVIHKRRHYIIMGDIVWEVDEFFGDNKGLIVAEVELSDIAQSIDTPSWIGREVTDDMRYTNLALSSNPFCNWGSWDQGD